MERPSHGNRMEVSAYWTPAHVDVTDEPVRYAGPKGTWIDEFRRLRPFVASDPLERMARRRAQTHAIVEANEILAPPPVAHVRDDAPPSLYAGLKRRLTIRPTV